MKSTHFSRRVFNLSAIAFALNVGSAFACQEHTAVKRPASKNVNPQQAELAIRKHYVNQTIELTAKELVVAKAYWILLGRIPDKGGLAFWASGQEADNLATFVDHLRSALCSSGAIDSDLRVGVLRAYYHLFGKHEIEDTDGIDYWVSVAGGSSFGAAMGHIDRMMADGSTQQYYFQTLYRNRLLVLESACRLQKAAELDLDFQSARSILLAPQAEISGYDEAMDELYTRLNSGQASYVSSWATNWTTESLLNASVAYANSSIRQVRNALWHNRSGQAMLATIYLPNNFSSQMNTRVVIACHGGGWKMGDPSNLDWFGRGLAANNNYVVVVPNYQLSLYGAGPEAPLSDVQDILSLVKDSSFLRHDPEKVGLFGESAGGHLAALTGCVSNAWRVMTLYAPFDLRGESGVSPELKPYRNSYAPTEQLQEVVSPTCRWSQASTTLFRMWHGVGDSLVPYQQSVYFAQLVGSKGSVQLLNDGVHGLTLTQKAQFLAEAGTFFAA